MRFHQIFINAFFIALFAYSAYSIYENYRPTIDNVNFNSSGVMERPLNWSITNFEKNNTTLYFLSRTSKDRRSIFQIVNTSNDCDSYLYAQTFYTEDLLIEETMTSYISFIQSFIIVESTIINLDNNRYMAIHNIPNEERQIASQMLRSESYNGNPQEMTIGIVDSDNNEFSQTFNMENSLENVIKLITLCSNEHK